MKYILYGNGWMAGLIKDYLREDAFISNEKTNEVFALDVGFDVVIDLAAHTNIDWCENNKNQTLQDNVLGAVNLARICKNLNKKYVFFSSGCIFESKNENDWKDENSQPNPQCFYAEMKWLAERLIQEVNPEALIVRPRLPISEKSHPRNTLNKLYGYKKINDTQESVDVVEDMIPVLIDLIKKNAVGIYHFANGGTVSPADLAGLIGNNFFEIRVKEVQDAEFLLEGRAKRVTTYLRSVKIPCLPHIGSRILQVCENWKRSHKDCMRISEASGHGPDSSLTEGNP